MNETKELISITEAAKRLGINRSTLHRFIKDDNVKKIKKGRLALVDYACVSQLVQKMAATGKVRTPKCLKQVQTSSEQQWRELYKEIKLERDQLKDRCNALETENREIKLLNAAKNNGGVFKKLSNFFESISN